MRVRDYSRPTTLNPDRLFGQVAQKLAVAIITGSVKAGELLPNEDDLRSDISVSRTAYREAVKVLTAKGLVEARPKSGTRAAPRDSWNLLDPDVLSWHFEADPNEKFIRDLFELRRFAEPAAAGLAAQRRTPADIARIEAAYRGMSDNHPYADATIRADLAFHEAVFAASHNATLMCLASAVAATVQWSLLLKSVDDRDFFVASLVDHERVLDAIIQRDGDLAAARMTTLVIDSLNTTLAFLTPGAAAPIQKTA
ncbi:MAG TPA: FadR/GntR family transcriptional regulator [Bosea sp. (in: a-proteobacteria)]|jgi:DNA-binding FadR family transcriptional regulator|uniref:FadR/GntR family transcriptional regulator n=1 Tax=Bosea sp. (in: a-proteobacteria) TaxID=1871050 RepID=UPI002E10D243|nr:FadR/GntR family transcriptional regulator [Bosea sp. (in: a-proteobacteria)]